MFLYHMSLFFFLPSSLKINQNISSSENYKKNSNKNLLTNVENKTMAYILEMASIYPSLQERRCQSVL